MKIAMHPQKVALLEKMEAVMNEEAFLVLVWGSGCGAGGDFEKREKVRTHLHESLGPGRVFFSEDAEFSELVRKRGLGVAEGLEVLTADAVVILDTSIGPHSEILKFEYLLREKAIVFVNERHRKGGGFAAVAYDSLRAETYSDSEFVTCETIRALATRFVQSILFQKVRPKLQAASRLGVAGSMT